MLCYSCEYPIYTDDKTVRFPLKDIKNGGYFTVHEDCYTHQRYTNCYSCGAALDKTDILTISIDEDRYFCSPRCHQEYSS